MRLKNPIHEIIYRLNVQEKLDLDLLYDAMIELLEMEESPVRNVQLGCLLTGVMARNPSVEEIVTLLKAAFSKDGSPNNEDKYKIELPNNASLISVVGSGKKGIKTVNISTASSIVASSIGCYVAKPGSSSVSSLTGSSDLLEEVGVNVYLPLEEMVQVLKNTHFGIFKIEKYLKNFGSLYNNKFFTPHVLSYGLAALANPVKTDKLLYGFTHYDVEKSLDVLLNFGFKNVLVVSSTPDGIHYIDEIGVYGENRIIGARNGSKGKLKVFQPVLELHLPKYNAEDIKEGSNVYENVKYVVDVLRGKGKQALEDIIAINVSSILYLDGKVEGLKEGYIVAKKEIKSGRPYEKLLEIIEATKGDKNKLRRY